MGLIDFVKDAGEKLFGHGQAQAAAKEAAAAPARCSQASGGQFGGRRRDPRVREIAEPVRNGPDCHLRRRDVDRQRVRCRAGPGDAREDRRCAAATSPASPPSRT